MTRDLEPVGQILREVAEAVVLPRFRALAPEHIEEKGPDDPVTVADRESEQMLEARLTDLLPGSRVLGEEAAHADPSVFRHLDTDDPVWVVDPIDGTRSFVEGSDSFCMIVALVRHGETVAGWVYRPTHEALTRAELGAGAEHEGERLQPLTARASAAGEDPKPFLIASYKRPKDRLLEALERAGTDRPIAWRPLFSAGLVYADVARGLIDASLFYSSKPWDHAAGVLFAHEVGGAAGYMDGTVYRATVQDNRSGILSVREPLLWGPLASAFTEARDRPA